MTRLLLVAWQCVADTPPPPAPDYRPGYWIWGLIALAVLIFEAWAIATGHHTMSQSVQHGPKWFRWLVGGGLVALLVHLFVWR